MDLDNGDAASKDEANSKPPYSMPGILHFIQHEWSRFEMERSQWDVERAELQAKIAFLQGERKGQENLKRDLVRRIKMLELALRQERARVHKLKFGTDLVIDVKSKEANDASDESKLSDMQSANSPTSWRHGRQLLRQYLQEVGYSDTILDVRSQRVRALLGSNYNHDGSKAVENNGRLVNGNIEDEDNEKSNRPFILDNNTHAKLNSSEKDLFKELNFATSGDDDKSDASATVNATTVEISDVADDDNHSRDMNAMDCGAGDMDGEEFGDTAVALAEFDFLNPSPDDDDVNVSTEWSVDQTKLSAMKEQFHREKRLNKKKGMKRPIKKDLQNMLDTLRGTDVRSSADDNVNISLPDDDSLPFTVGGPPRLGDESIDSALGLGDLAGLTVANEADMLSYDISAVKEPFRKTWSPKFTLRSHFDGVRGIRFLPNESGVITASDDHTLKLWNLNKPLPSKRTQSLDVEPIYSFRGHLGPVLCLEVDGDGTMCYSGGSDSTVRCWSVPSINTDPYDAYDSSVAGNVLVGHTDAVWSLSYSGSRQQILSASADMTIRLWNPLAADPLLQTYKIDGSGTPTCVEFVGCDSNHAVVSHSNGKIAVYDLETGKTPVILADADDLGEQDRVNYVVTHPTMPITITAHDNRHIKFFDNSSGKQIHSMVAHLGVVTSLSVDPNGLYLLSGSHDCSIRLWNLDNKTCIQELTSHRKKFDEAIYSVAFHPTSAYIASAGADALAKVFV